MSQLGCISELLAALEAFPGKTGFYYKNLVTGEVAGCREEQPLLAASVIKLPVLLHLCVQVEAGNAGWDELFMIREEDKLPSCGALRYLRNGLKVTLEDLAVLMIILSDNTATNLLIRRFGIDEINRTILSHGFGSTVLNRLLFDSAAAGRGLENMVSPKDMGLLLEGLYREELVSPAMSRKMLDILSNQRLNSKIPFALPSGTKVAHKTGEDSGITHDVGIVFAPQPFVVCFCSNEVKVPAFERLIQDGALLLYEANA